MKRVFYFAAAALAACAVMVSCNKDDGDGPNPPSGTTRLAVPQPSVIDTTDNGIVVGWSAIANAATYDVVVNDDEDNIISVSENQYEVPTPTGGTYRVRVRSVPAEGSEYTASQWSTTVEFTVRASAGEVPAEYQPWVGFWDVESTQTLTWVEGADGYVSPQISEAPFSTTVEFYYVTDALQDQNGNPVGCLLMEGWAKVAEANFNDTPLPIICMIDETGGLGLYTGFDIGTTDQGIPFGPYGVGEVGNDTPPVYSVITGQYPAYTLTLNGETATAAAYSGTLQDERPFTVVALDIFGISGQSVSVYNDGGSLSGTITLTKSASQSAARFACSMGELESFSAEVFGVAGALETK